MTTLLIFQTRCGCTREIKIPGYFTIPPYYHLPLRLKNVTVQSYRDYDSLEFTKTESRAFKLIDIIHRGSDYPTAIYREV